MQRKHFNREYKGQQNDLRYDVEVFAQRKHEKQHVILKNVLYNKL